MRCISSRIYTDMKRAINFEKIPVLESGARSGLFFMQNNMDKFFRILISQITLLVLVFVCNRQGKNNKEEINKLSFDGSHLRVERNLEINESPTRNVKIRVEVPLQITFAKVPNLVDMRNHTNVFNLAR